MVKDTCVACNTKTTKGEFLNRSTIILTDGECGFHCLTCLINIAKDNIKRLNRSYRAIAEERNDIKYKHELCKTHIKVLEQSLLNEIKESAITLHHMPDSSEDEYENA